MMSAIHGQDLVMQRQFDGKSWMELVQKEKVNRYDGAHHAKQLLDNPDSASTI
jgi:hypothetical protein